MEIIPYQTMSYLYNATQIQYLNMPEGLELDVSETEPLEVVISGMDTVLAAVSMEQVLLSVDMSECARAGTYTLPVTVTAPEGCVVPENLQITVGLVRSEDKDE